MIGLTHKQRDCLAFIRAYMAEHGASPSFEEIREGLGLTSKSGVHRLLQALEERGRIRRLHDRARTIEIVDANPLAGVPLADLLAEIDRRTGGSATLGTLAAAA